MIVGTTDSSGSRARKRASRDESARTKNLSEAATFRGLGPRGCRSRDVSALLVRTSVVFADEGKESSERRYVGDAWAHRGDEGRGKLR